MQAGKTQIPVQVQGVHHKAAVGKLFIGRNDGVVVNHHRCHKRIGRFRILSQRQNLGAGRAMGHLLLCRVRNTKLQILGQLPTQSDTRAIHSLPIIIFVQGLAGVGGPYPLRRGLPRARHNAVGETFFIQSRQ